MIGGIIGELGAAKTATLAFLAEHHAKNGSKIYANFMLTRVNFNLVSTMRDIDDIKKGYFCADELWQWLDSRTSQDEYNRQINQILLSSRKRGYNLLYTAQGLHQIDKRLRLITHYVLVPRILYVDPNTGESYAVEQDFLHPVDLGPYMNDLAVYVDVCTVVNRSTLKQVDEFSFWLGDVIHAYDTNEEIQDIRNTTGKGIMVENMFKVALEGVFEQDIENGTVSIYQPNYSGQGQNTLDMELKVNDELYIFDVTTIAKRTTKGHLYRYIDQAKKDVKKTLKMLNSRNALGFYTWHYEKKWYCLPITDELILKKMINIDKVEGVIPFCDMVPALKQAGATW